MKKTSIIVGSDGQDGKIIISKLKSQKHKIIKIKKKNFDINNFLKVKNLVKKFKPHNIYFFAAFHHSADHHFDNKLNINSIKINLIAPNNFLECIYKYRKKCKFFYSSSSLIFKSSKKKHNEKSLIEPKEIYSICKSNMMSICNFYRSYLNIFINVGIFYNHESEFRKNNFLSKKIIINAVKNYRGSNKKLKISSLETRIDWGSAHDYMDAVLMLQNLKHSDNFIISTGKTHTILDFIKITYNYLKLDYRKYVIEKKNNLIRNEKYRCGSPNKLMKATGWKPKITFKKMIENMIDYELKL